MSVPDSSAYNKPLVGCRDERAVRPAGRGEERCWMSLLIDGYNLLNATALGGSCPAGGTLAAARLAVLNFVADSLPADQVPKTTVVFDAGPGAPRARARVHTYRGLTVHFASDYADADELIEQLIASDTAPRSLTVVSSDHRLHRAARRRRARAVDSDRWYAEVLQQQRQRRRQAVGREKPPPPASQTEVDYWLRLFADPSSPADPPPSPS
ncbi:MAG: hypothetical protein GTO03_13390 [Planctomycetales bacterium]|nr:hypothetical protein [Planctomycetales bacterium]